MNQQTGKAGELIAADYLSQQGYEVVCKNYRCRFGEIDLIARKGTILCFIEVKTRRTQKYGLPREAVTRAKQQVILRTAQQYIQRYGPKGYRYRFDVMEVYFDVDPVKIIHLTNAFQ